MAQHLSDDEQLQVLKNWWNENGRQLIIIVALGLAGYFGWQWWMQYQKDYAESAAAVYAELSDTVDAASNGELSEDQQKTAQFLIEQLQKDYGSSLYAVNASLLAAKLAVQQEDLAKAEEELKNALNTKDADLKVVASLRLAKVYFAQEKYDEALKQAAYDQEDAFSSEYAAVRGDVLVAKGEMELARAEYQKALDGLNENSSLQRRLLEIKLSDLPAGDQS